MKLLLHIFLLSLAFNAFSQDLIPAAENDTLKIVSVKGKVGLRHKNGQQILEPIYSDVKIEPLGIRFYDGPLQGYLPAGKQTAIPANYKEIISVYGYFEGKTENNTVDLYYGNELIAEGLDTAPLESDVLLESSLIVIRKDEKAGIMDQKGKIIVPLEYSTIDRVKSFRYEIKDRIPMDYLLVLDKAPFFYSPEINGFYRMGDPQFMLMKGDGTLISDSVFTEVSEMNPDKNEISLRLTKKLATLNSQFEISYSPYVDIKEFMEWKFGFTGTENVIHNRFNDAVDTFLFVSIPIKLSWIYTQDGEMTSNYDTQPLFEDFVYVQKMTDGQDFEILTAIYDLKNQQVVSGWEKTITFVRKGINPSGSIVWIYKNELDQLAYTISGSNKNSKYEYHDIYQVNQQFYAFKKFGDATYTLCELIGDSVFVERMAIEKSFGSLNYVGINTPSVQDYDPNREKGFLDDFGNYSSFSAEEQPGIGSPFTVPFTLIKNQKGKLGFISWDGKVVDLNADTLFQSVDSGTLIEYKCGGLWGAADVRWGNSAKADQSAPGFFKVLNDLALIYRLGEDEKHYVDEKGRIFYSTNSERYISQKDKFKGSEVYSEFPENDSEKYVAFPYVYSEILPTWNGVHFLAQGKNKKWGVISAFNDTLFPFKYDELGFAVSKKQPFPVEFPYRDYDEQCFTRVGESHGILSLNLRKEIPAVYDQVNYVPNAAFIVRKNGKSGVYDYLLNEKIKPVYDEVFIASSKEGVFVLRARKANKWFAMAFFEGKVPDQTTFQQLPGFDLMINETGFIKTDSGYEARDLNNVVIQKEAVMSEYLDENQFKLVDGKIFLIDLKGKLLYPDALTNIVHLEDGRVITSENGVTYSYATWTKLKEVIKE